MVTKILGRILSSVISALLAWVWAVQCSGLVAALIPSLNDVATTTVMIRVITIVMTLLAVVLIWTGLLNFTSAKGVKATSIAISLYFVTLIAVTIGYMAVLGDIKYVMLAEVAGAWIIWFAILSSLSTISKRIEDAEKSGSEIVDKLENSGNQQ